MSQGKTEFFLVVSILQSCFVIFSNRSGGRQERSVHGHKASTSFVCQLAIELLSFHLLFRKSVHAFFEMILPALRNLLDVCKSSSLRLPPTSRLFSIRHVNCDSTEDAIALKEAKRKARNVRNNENRTLQLLTDPDYYKRYYERQSGHFHKWYQKPEVRERIRVKHKLDQQRKRAEDSHYHLKKMIVRWCYRYPWVCEELDWKSHVPVSSEQRISRLCTGCGCRRTGGQRLWFRRKYDPDLYDCFTCFLGTDPVQALPRGCEDIRTIMELRVRKGVLDAQGFTSKSSSGDTAKDSKESEP